MRVVILCAMVLLSGCANHIEDIENLIEPKKINKNITMLEMESEYLFYERVFEAKDKKGKENEIALIICEKKEEFNYQIKCKYFKVDSGKKNTFKEFEKNIDGNNKIMEVSWEVEEDIINYSYRKEELIIPLMKSLEVYEKKEEQYTSVGLRNHKHISINNGNAILIYLR